MLWSSAKPCYLPSLLFSLWSEIHIFSKKHAALLPFKSNSNTLNFCLKVSRNQKEFLVFSILPKNERKMGKNHPKSSQDIVFCFFERIENSENCFQDLLTFRCYCLSFHFQPHKFGTKCGNSCHSGFTTASKFSHHFSSVIIYNTAMDSSAICHLLC